MRGHVWRAMAGHRLHQDVGREGAGGPERSLVVKLLRAVIQQGGAPQPRCGPDDAALMGRLRLDAALAFGGTESPAKLRSMTNTPRTGSHPGRSSARSPAAVANA